MRTLREWLARALVTRPRPGGPAPPPAHAEATAGAPRLAVPREYRSLHEYLDGRFANTVVLTFAQIEDLLGFALPERARLQQEWWANADPYAAPSAQSRSWIQASRSATPNLPAQIVVFERASA